MLQRIRDVLSSPAVRLLVYFAVVASVLVMLGLPSPWFRASLVPAGGTGAGLTDLESAFEGSAPALPSPSVMETLITAFILLLAGLALAAPVVWIYMVVMRQEGYERSFVRMLSTLPVVVAGVVQVVRGDLALAFALAGIVAAVRFRTTVKDLQNAVFAFSAIGIGLAAGSGSLLLAGALSVTVCFLAYALWKLRVGNVEPSLELAHSGVPLSEALVPGVTHRPVVIGSDAAAEPVHAADLEPLAESIDRLADFVAADALRRKKKYDMLLLAYTDRLVEAEGLISGVLEEHAKRWVKVDTIERSAPGSLALVYLVRLKKDVEVGQMILRLGCGEGEILKAVELKPIKGLRKRLT